MRIGRLHIELCIKLDEQRGWECKTRGPVNMVYWCCPYCYQPVSPNLHHVSRLVRLLQRIVGRTLWKST